MFRQREIPVLLLSDDSLVKTTKFKKPNYIGDPINAIRLFNDFKADELIFLDINASKRGVLINPELVKELSEETDMPFSVGGGIRNVSDIELLIRNGAEKVVIGSGAITSLNFVTEAVKEFGASTISICMDVKKKWLGKNYLFDHTKKRIVNLNPCDFAKQIEQTGVGELIVQSVDKDGTMTGYDLELIRSILEIVSLPIISLGGANSLKDFETLKDETNINAFAAGSLFVYKGDHKGVLINYPNRT